MASQFWSSADLKAIEFGGLIREDVMGQIWDISAIPLPVQDMISDDTVKNSRTEWTTDELASPDITNARVDGSDSTGNDATGGARVGNECQISTKDVQVTTRARTSDVVGRSDELSYQVMMRQRELRRDVDAIYLENQASQVDDGDTVPGLTGGLPAWLETNVAVGAGGVVGGFDPVTGLVDAYTPGAARNLTEDDVRDVSEGIFNEGGEATKMLSTPAAIRKFSEYMFTSSARIATLQSDQPGQRAKQTGKGSVNVFVSDFSVLEFVPDRLQQTYTDAVATQVVFVFILDPMLLRLGKLNGYAVDPLAKTGLADKRLMRVDWCVKVLNEKGNGMVADVDPTLAATTS